MTSSMSEKILKTKKRLSSDRWFLPVITLAICCLLFLMTAMLRSVGLQTNYGLVTASIPVVAIDYQDPSFSRTKIQAQDRLDDQTTTILLTPGAFYFGELKAFTKDFLDARNKFLVPHIDGSPDLKKLLTDLHQWQKFQNKPTNSKISVLVPTGDIPTPILIQTIAALKASPSFEHIVLAGGVE